MYLNDPGPDQPYVRKLRRRILDPQHAHALTFSCYRGYPFLGRDRTRSWFVEALLRAREDWGFDLWAYVLMPEHVHLLVRPRTPGSDLSRFLRGVKEPVARRAIDHLRRNSPGWFDRITVREGARDRRRFWQPGGGYDRNLFESRALLAEIDYIHANPVRRGLSERPEDWPWSSAAWYAGREGCLLAMDRTLPPC